MHIICKEKDYYDFVGYGENGSEDVTFDRRNMWVIKPANSELYDKDNILHVIHSMLCTQNTELTERVIGVFIGFNLYIIYISAEKDRKEKYLNYQYEIRPFKYNAELIAKRICYDIKHPKPIDFVTIETSVWDYLNYRLKTWKDLNYRLKTWKDLKNYQNAKTSKSHIAEREYKEGNPNNWKINPLFSKDWESEKSNNKIPILKNTFIPKLVSAEECYRNIEEWLISQYNDVDQESEGLTDVDKAINHGFDKKTSFRNVK